MRKARHLSEPAGFKLAFPRPTRQTRAVDPGEPAAAQAKTIDKVTDLVQRPPPNAEALGESAGSSPAVCSLGRQRYLEA